MACAPPSPDPSRFFVNTLPPAVASQETGDPRGREELQSFLADLWQRLQRQLAQLDERGDFNLYTGEGGIVFTLLKALRAGSLVKDSRELQDYVRKLEGFSRLRDTETRRSYAAKRSTSKLPVTFICGWSGMLCMQMELARATSKFPEADSLFKSCLAEIGFPTASSAPAPSVVPLPLQNLLSVEGAGCDEVLYGRAGYLYSLLYVVKQFPSDVSEEQLDVIRRLTAAIIERGRRNAQRIQARMRGAPCPPLYYEWHDSDYLGAAHGLAGICLMLLQVAKLPRTRGCITEAQLELVKGCLAYMMTLPLPSGNYPSRIFPRDSSKDKLVQFCHGAPGMVLLFCTAFEAFGSQGYLRAAGDAADAVWKFGLLKKGTGLCHGVAGNGYAFLALYRVTQERRYLERAWQFAEFSVRLHRDPHLKRQITVGDGDPEAAASLFEGTAALICYLLDVLNPNEALFPGVEL